MTAKIYAFRLAIALVTFSLGFSIFSAWQFLPKFQSNQQIVSSALPKIEQVEPICRFEKIETVTTAAEPLITESPNLSEFDAGGDYYMVGKLPKGFEEFDSLSILTNEYKPNAKGDYEPIPIPPEGSLFTNKDFKFSRINISNRQISFVTESVKGISYKFTGAFLEEKDFYTIKDETVVLKGQLIKMKDGKKMAESKVKFGYLDCC